MAHIVGIRFHGGGKTYHFNASSVPEIKKGEYVIVETSRGQQLGQVVSFKGPGGKKGRNWKPILRSATSRDLVMRQVNLSQLNSVWKVKTWYFCTVMKGMTIPRSGTC